MRTIESEKKLIFNFNELIKFFKSLQRGNKRINKCK